LALIGWAFTPNVRPAKPRRAGGRTPACCTTRCSPRSHCSRTRVSA
jgi:hypothetical protein